MSSLFFNFSQKDLLEGKNILDLGEEGTFTIDDRLFFDDEAGCIAFTGQDDKGNEYEFAGNVDILANFDLEQATEGDILNFPIDELQIFKRNEEY